VEFRVNTRRGIQFRRWANQVLKDYMLKGFTVNQRKIATDLQIAEHLQEQRQLIDNQETRISNVDDRLSSVESHMFKGMGVEFSAYRVLNFVTPDEIIEKVNESTKGK
jgi:hypothetical protein